MINAILNSLIPIAHAAEAAGAATSANPFTSFGVDWQHLLAQLVNFLIVFWLLARFVFKPLVKKLDERSHKIDKSLKNAKAIEEKLRQTEEQSKAEIEKSRLRAAEIIANAQRLADKTEADMVRNAQASADKVIVQARKEIAGEKEKLLAEVREEAAGMIMLATEKIIKEKLDAKKDHELIKESLKNL